MTFSSLTLLTLDYSYRLDMSIAGSKKDPKFGIIQGECGDLNICPDFILSLLTAFAAFAFQQLYQAITVAAAAGRRRKRSGSEMSPSFSVNFFNDLAFLGTIFYNS